MDLPNKPWSAERLLIETYETVHEWTLKLEDWRLSLDFRVSVNERKYGARVKTVWFQKQQRDVNLLETTFRVKNNFGFEGLCRHLESLTKFAESFKYDDDED